MFPGFNPLPHRPSQVPVNHSSQQVVAANPMASTTSNMFANGMPIQHQMGIFPQNVAAINGLISQMSNNPNNLLSLHSNQVALQHLMGFAPQNNMQTLNALPGQFFNMGQSPNPLNLLQTLNGNMLLPNSQFCMPNSQFCMPNAMQNANQLLSMQMSNPPQVPHYNGPRFPSPPMNSDCLRQQINQSSQTLVSSGTQVHGVGPVSINNQQPQENNAATVNFRPDQASAAPGIPPSPANKFQGNSYSKGGGSNSHFRNFQRKDYTMNRGKEGFQRSHFHNKKNGNHKFNSAGGPGGKETSNDKTQKFGPHHSTSPANEKKRVSITYTEQEIRQWREERRKNHPSNSHAIKKQGDSSINEKDSKTRFQQLKDILAKQAELGVEVAEIPSHYLAESGNNFPKREENRKFAKEDRFQNRHNKKRKRNHRERTATSNRSDDTVSPGTPSLRKGEPTLLKKLLSKDIKRDKLRLLQAFRFMVMNSFFRDGPERPLKFPTVILSENGTQGSVLEERCSVATEADSGDGPKKIASGIHDTSLGSNEGSVSTDNTGEEGDNGLCVHEEDEEEGEIID
ncbi:hypothetical protein SAY86_030543 [Trapa natans]|uniref:FMR1-interacting protein 1 conserved domain-containing protein n=1 Tax=Trapa natans TaxID=22666 RepID=A0AAN7MG71_TRANT|nr:hypothetical protein SAY86_030543 [Trapa natans]